jgi:predicted transposase/invertase (TIGR01784 family)
MATETPHDSLFKRVFSTPENAVGVLRALVPPALNRVIDWSTLELAPGTFVDDHLAHRHTDLLYTVRCGDSKVFIYVLFEHQSTGDRLMAFRILRYMVKVWDAFLAREKDAARLPAILPIVLQHEPGGWRHSTDLSALIGLDPQVVEALGDHLPRLRFLLDDLPKITEEELSKRALTATAAITLLLLRKASTSPDLLADLERWRDLLVSVLSARNGLQAMRAILEYISGVADIPPQNLQRFVHELGPVAEEAFMTTAQMLRNEGQIKGELKGRAEGELKGRAATLLEQLAEKFGPLDDATARRIRDASPDELGVWTRRILRAGTVDDVFG